MISYRSEEPFGEGYRDVVPVLVHEICELENDGTLDTMISGMYDIPEALVKECRETMDADEIDKEIVTDLCKRLIAEVSRSVGYEVKYCLWLTSKEAIINLYCHGNEDVEIDAYETGCLLYDGGYDGSLYGYERLPQPLPKSEE